MSFLKKLSLNSLRELLGSVEIKFAGSDVHKDQQGKVQDVKIEYKSLEDMPLRTLKEKIAYLALCFQKQNEIIDLSKTDAYHINTLKANVDNNNMSDKAFRDLFRNTEFSQASIKDL